MSLPEAHDPAAYRFWATEQVRFADLDPLGHVSNAVYAVYVESGRAAFLSAIGLWVQNDPRQHVVVNLQIDYRREITYPAQVRIGSRVLDIGRSSYRIGCGIFIGEVCAATAITIGARWDTRTRRSTPLDEQERAQLLNHR